MWFTFFVLCALHICFMFHLVYVIVSVSCTSHFFVLCLLFCFVSWSSHSFHFMRFMSFSYASRCCLMFHTFGFVACAIYCFLFHMAYIFIFVIISCSSNVIFVSCASRFLLYFSQFCFAGFTSLSYVSYASHFSFMHFTLLHFASRDLLPASCALRLSASHHVFCLICGAPSCFICYTFCFLFHEYHISIFFSV